MARHEQDGTPPPRISLGMPLYNAGETVRRAIDSLLNQTATDFELIISDNCSTDGTYEICREYAARDKRIILLRNDSNLGSIQNFKIVCRAARGKYFQWVAGDDYWYPEYLERLAGELDAHPRCVMVTALMKREYTGGEPLPTISFEGFDNPARLPRFLLAARCLSTRTKIRDKKYNLLIYGMMKRLAVTKMLDTVPFHQGERHFGAHMALCGGVRAVNEVLMYKQLHRKPLVERHGESSRSQMAQEQCPLRRLNESIRLMLASPAIPWYSKAVHVPLLIATLLTERKIRHIIKLRLRGQTLETHS